MKKTLYTLCLALLSWLLASSAATAQTCIAEAGPNALITCANVLVTLDGSASSVGPEFSYQWSGPGIVSAGSTLTPVVNQPGVYTLLVTNNTTSCTATDEVLVEEDIISPIANAGPDALLTCANPTAMLFGANSSTGPGFTYEWSGPLIPGQSNAINATASEPGIYTLTVTDNTNGCTASDEVLVFQNISFPIADAGPDVTLTCVNTTVTLDGNSPSTGPSFQCQWSGPGINSVNIFLVNPTVSEPGQYCIVVTNTTNGCTATDCVNVLLDAVIPTVSISGGTLSCSNPVATLSANPGLPNQAYEWTGPDGQIIGTTPTIEVGVEATYGVLVTNTDNGCTSTWVVNVSGDTTLPRVDAVVTDALCGNTGSIALTPDPAGQQLTYEWSNAATGSTVTGLTPGNYWVTITDTQSSCSKVIFYRIRAVPSLLFSTTVTPALCAGPALGAISVNPINGISPYTYSWTGPNGFTSSQQNINNLAAGSYTVTIVDAADCSAVSSPIVLVQPPILTIETSSIMPACDAIIGSITIFVSGGTQPYTYSWSDNSATNNPTINLPPGTYTLTVTDANGCTAIPIQEFIIPVAPQVLINPQIIETCNDVTVILSPVPGGADYAYVWSNGATGPVLNNGGFAGFYTVTVIDVNTGCTAVFSFDLGSGSGNTLCGAIRGRVVNDLSEDCNLDAGEPGLSGWIVQAIGADTFYTVSGPGGWYQMGVLPGAYTLRAVLINGLWTDCPIAPTVTATAGDTLQADIFVQAAVECPALTVDLSTNQLRRCFAAGNYYYAHYCNNGPAPATNAYVLLTLDPFLTPIVSSVPYIALGSNVFRFNIGTVQPGECDFFWVNVAVSCEAVLGQTHCSEAHIFPDTLCTSDPSWSGASVQVNARCEGDSVHFTLKNVGNGPMSNELDYIVIEDAIMLMQASAPPLAVGDSVNVAVPANGATWRVEAQQEPFHPAQFLPAASVEGCTVNGSFSTGFVAQFANADAGPAVDVDCTPNIGSFDPNDKQGFPLGYGPSHYIRPGTALDYKIRFQNTGTDTAFTVVVRDTLSAWLDPATVVAGASSHAYQFALEGEGVVVFTFDNILLPDSFVNEVASNGFVQFRVAPRAEVPLETDILNQAAIYFDFNEPVLTNTTWHRVGENFILTGIFSPAQPLTKVRILPNPVSATARVELDEWPTSQRTSE